MHIARTLLVNQNLETRMGLTLVGELDRESVPLLQTALQNCLQPVGRGDIEINVEGLTFCDVSGLNALLAAARRRHGQFRTSPRSIARRRQALGGDRHLLPHRWPRHRSGTETRSYGAPRPVTS
ncbi:STAS domain-containing protein [Streptomyces agglomeratus]|uniref:STAS domain-containing protein n=1 Tax=Streptomyces agglomeratus TaxID=285458 RepID=UPI00099FC3A3